MIYRVERIRIDSEGIGYRWCSSAAEAAKEAAEWRRIVREELREGLEEADIFGTTADTWADRKDEYSDAAIITAYPTPKNKRELLRLLKDVAGHPNNG